MRGCNIPIYDWRCQNPECGEEVQVSRSMAEFERGPDEACGKCGSVTFKRFIKSWSKTQVSLVHGGTAPWHDESYFNGRIPTGK